MHSLYLDYWLFLILFLIKYKKALWLARKAHLNSCVIYFLNLYSLYPDYWLFLIQFLIKHKKLRFSASLDVLEFLKHSLSDFHLNPWTMMWTNRRENVPIFRFLFITKFLFVKVIFWRETYKYFDVNMVLNSDRNWRKEWNVLNQFQNLYAKIKIFVW